MNPEQLLSRIRVVLCQPSHPGNIGAAARAMKTMGLSELHLVNPKQFPDPEASTRATGAVDVLEAAVVHPDLDSALADTVFAAALSARRRDLGPQPMPGRTLMPMLLDAARSGPVALVFGTEKTGLSNEEVLRCQAAVTIPANPEFSSLNLGAAVQLMCYEARIAAYDGQLPEADPGVTAFASPPASAGEVEGLLAHLERVSTASGFHNPAQPGRLFAKLRRLFARSRLERDEVNILRGILASTEEKTGHGRR